MLRFMVMRKQGLEPEVLYSANELELARAFYARERQGLKIAGYKVNENASFSDKPIIPFAGNIYEGDIESLSWYGHGGSGLMAIKVFNEI